MKKRGFCEFSKNLYWGPGVKKRALVKLNLFFGRRQFNILCITKAMNEHDQLDIIKSVFLKQPYYREHPAYVYGIASSQAEAFDIILRISQEASIAGLDGKLAEYLKRK